MQITSTVATVLQPNTWISHDASQRRNGNDQVAAVGSEFVDV